jgi:hypothetical protein
VAIVDGMTVDGGLSVDEALDTEVIGVVAVKGYLFDDGAGLRLRNVLAESLPPQCGGASLTVADFDFDRIIEWPECELVGPPVRRRFPRRRGAVGNRLGSCSHSSMKSIVRWVATSCRSALLPGLPFCAR